MTALAVPGGGSAAIETASAETEKMRIGFLRKGACTLDFSPNFPPINMKCDLMAKNSSPYTQKWLMREQESRPKAAFSRSNSTSVLCGGRCGVAAAAHLQADATEADDHHRPGAELRNAWRRRREVLLDTDILEEFASRRDLRDEIAVEVGVGDAVEVGGEEK